jgi:hypothetical protein
MNVIERNGIEWRLDDQRLVEALDTPLLSGDRRPLWIRDYGGGKAFIKLFREKGLIGALRNWISPRGQKEYETALRLRGLAISTPRPLGYGKGRMCSASIQEWKEGKDFLTLFGQTPDRSQLLQMLASLHTTLKKEGVRHNDLHLRNIIVCLGVAHVVDLHKTAIKRFFSLSDELNNMCHSLFSIYPDMTEEEKTAFFAFYGNTDIRTGAETELTRLRADWAWRKKKRAFKSTSLLQADGLTVRIKEVGEARDCHFVESVKKDRKTQVERYSDHVRKVYRNRRRLKRAWANHVALEYMELEIGPKPFYVRKASLGRSGFVAMEDLERKGEDLSRFIAANYGRLSMSGEIKPFVDRFASFLLLLFKWQITHKDLKTSNIYYLWDGSFRLLDIEDICFDAFRGDYLKDALVQLNKSVPKIVRTDDRLRFLSRLSKGLSLPRSERKALLRSVREESLRDDIVYVGPSGTVRETWT